MTEKLEAPVRALVVELVESAPPAPPFPAAELVAAAPARRPFVRPLLAAAVVIALLAVAIGAVALFGRDGEDRPPVVTPTPTTGSAIAYVGDDGLYVAASGGGEARRVVSGGVRRPRWSYDGKYLAYEDARGVLWVSEPGVAGNRPQSILPSPRRWEWSPVRNWLALVNPSTPPSVEVWDPNADIVSGYPGASDFSWAPGGFLYFAKQSGAGRDDLFIARPGRDDVRRVQLNLVLPTGADRGLVLGPTSPDGEPVIWLDTAYGSTSTLMDAPPLYIEHGRPAGPVGHMFVQRSWAQWSRDGTFAFVETSGRMVTDERTLKVCIVNAPCRTVLDDGSQTMEPGFTPDGRGLAFVRNPAAKGYPHFVDDKGERDWRPLYAERQLWIARADGSGASMVKQNGGGVSAPAWLSETRILYATTNGRLRVYDLTTKTASTVAQLATSDDLPPTQPYDPTDANGELQWADLFAVAPVAPSEPEPASHVGQRFTFAGPSNEALFGGVDSGLYYQAGGCLGTACNPYGVAFVANTPVDKGAGMQGYLWLTKVVGGTGGANPLTEVRREVRVDVGPGLEPAVDCHRAGDPQHNVFAIVRPSSVDGAKEAVVRAWWTDGPGERVEELDPSTVECRVVVD